MEKFSSLLLGASIAAFAVSFYNTLSATQKKRLRIVSIIVFVVSLLLGELTGQGFTKGFKAGSEWARPR